MKTIFRGNGKVSYSLLVNFVNAFFPLLTVPLVLRAMDAQTYGDYVIVNVIYQIVNSIFVLSLIQYFIREYTKNTTQGVSGDEVTSSIISFQIFLAIISISIYIVASVILNLINVVNISIALVFLLPILASSLNVEWYFYAVMDYKVIFYRTLLVKSLLLLAVFILVKSPSDLLLYSFIMAISYALTYLSGFLYVGTLSLLKKLMFTYVSGHLVRSKIFFANSLIGVGYQYVDQVMVAIFLSKPELASLNILKQVLVMANMVPSTICRYWLPSAIANFSTGKNKEYHRKNIKIYLTILFSIVVGYFVFGLDFLKLLATSKYGFTQIDIYICAACTVITSIAVYIDTQTSIPLELEKITTGSNISVLIIVCLLFYPLALCFGYRGPLLSLMIGEFSGVLIMLYLHKFFYKTGVY